MRQLERALRSRVAILPELSVRGGLTCRAVALGCLLLIANAYWIMAGLMWRQHRPTTVSLFVNVVFTLWILVLLNRAIAHVAPKRALRPQELVIIYAILTLGSAMCSLDFMQPFIAVIAYPIWFATPSNRWDVLLLPHIPTSLVVTDKTALKDYVTGHSSFYYVDTMKAWMTPLVVWGIFMLLLVFGMLALVILLQREWTERARLSYPIVQTPYELIRRDGVLGRKSLWVGFIIAASMNLINGLHELYPSFPAIGGVRFDISPYFTQRPWNAIGWTPLVLLPFGIGLGFLIPLDLALSCWLFYLFWKLERIVTAATGWGDIPNFPYIEEQQFGAYMGLAVASLWVSRSYIATAARAAFAVKHHDNASEANSHIRIAGYSLWAFIACFIGLLIFCLRFGMRLWVASLFFASYYLLSIGITRLRAELGSPVHDLHRGGPNLVMVNAIGTNFLSPRDLSMLSLFHFFNRAYRGHAMPHQLESFKLGQLLHARFRDVGIALAIATIVGIIAGYWALLHVSYLYAGRYWYGRETFTRLQAWLTSPTGFQWGRAIAVVLGFGQAMLLAWVRAQWVWLPLHPAGFAVSGNWSMNLFWVSLMFAWAIKATLLKYAGLESYRRALPFFIGLIVGDYAMGSVWSLWGCMRHRAAYNFLP